MKAQKRARNGVQKEYSKLKIDQETYEIGDTVEVKISERMLSFGTILKIWSDNLNNPKIRVRWLVKPIEIFEPKPFFSQGELFDTESYDVIAAQDVCGKIKLMEFDEYHNREIADDNSYFTRATVTKNKKIRPPFSEWKKICICKSIFNPDDIHVVCEGCEEIFHPDCVVILDEAEPWYCSACLH